MVRCLVIDDYFAVDEELEVVDDTQDILIALPQPRILFVIVQFRDRLLPVVAGRLASHPLAFF